MHDHIGRKVSRLVDVRQGGRVTDDLYGATRAFLSKRNHRLQSLDRKI